MKYQDEKVNQIIEELAKQKMKSVLISIQPYWVFLIIAKAMGWDIPQEKTVEVRKDYPKDKLWNKVAHIYCCKNRKSFKRIPKQYQPFMKELLGKVIGEFICDRTFLYKGGVHYGITQDDRLFYCGSLAECTGLTRQECLDYGKKEVGVKGLTFTRIGYILQNLYGWHISDLKIYDKPKELGEFYRPIKYDGDYPICGTEQEMSDIGEWDCQTLFNVPDNCDCTLKDCPKLRDMYKLTRPFQSWGYVV